MWLQRVGSKFKILLQKIVYVMYKIEYIWVPFAAIIIAVCGIQLCLQLNKLKWELRQLGDSWTIPCCPRTAIRFVNLVSSPWAVLCLCICGSPLNINSTIYFPALDSGIDIDISPFCVTHFEILIANPSVRKINRCWH